MQLNLPQNQKPHRWYLKYSTDPRSWLQQYPNWVLLKCTGVHSHDKTSIVLTTVKTSKLLGVHLSLSLGRRHDGSNIVAFSSRGLRAYFNPAKKQKPRDFHDDTSVHCSLQATSPYLSLQPPEPDLILNSTSTDNDLLDDEYFTPTESQN